MIEKRTRFQCAARGCDGCIVCCPEYYSDEELQRYRESLEYIESLEQLIEVQLAYEESKLSDKH